MQVDEQGAVTLIDFPQMVSTSHANAEELFERDVDCIVRFFTKKLGYVPEQDTSLPYMRPDFKVRSPTGFHVSSLPVGRPFLGDLDLSFVNGGRTSCEQVSVCWNGS
jgi:hypothetical protein